MKSNLKPAGAQARALLKKLEALAERGVDGERISARAKIARLKSRFDFAVADPVKTIDLFFGDFKPSNTARRVYSFHANEFDLANAVKWAIESATKIPCVYRDGELLAEATSPTIKRLTEISAHIANSFRALLEKFSAVDGVKLNDRTAFVMGLYDGMMNEARSAGQRLPSPAPLKKRRKVKKCAVTDAPGLHIHPYTTALSLGKQIRFSAPLAQITAELEAVMQKHLAEKTDLARQWCTFDNLVS
jgi:hypothetical protein